MYKYCGYGTIEGEGMNVIINLNSQYYTKGGRFACVMQTKKFEENDCECGQRNPVSMNMYRTCENTLFVLTFVNNLKLHSRNTENTLVFDHNERLVYV